MKFFRRMIRLVLALYAACCALFIWTLPLSGYEWMLDDPALKGERLSFCTLPIDHDTFLGSALGAVALPLLLLVASIALSIRRRKAHYALWISLALLLVWALRFFVFAPSCPDRSDY